MVMVKPFRRLAVRGAEAEEMAEVATVDLARAELVKNQVAAHASDCKHGGHVCEDKLVPARLSGSVGLNQSSMALGRFAKRLSGGRRNDCPACACGVGFGSRANDNIAWTALGYN
jgi:hypothetical protein